MRMTRESYFKIAESQGLHTMREQSITLNESPDGDPFLKNSPLGAWKT